MQRIDLAPALGSIVEGLELAGDLTPEACRWMRAALCERQVLFFLDQDLSAVRQLQLARVFGEPVASPHPKFGCVDGIAEVSLVVNDEQNPPDINVWHSDLSYHQQPATVCVLHCRELPTSGGDTLWASMTAAYRALSAPMKQFLAPLTALHQLPLDGYPRDQVRKALDKPISATHPVIRLIPETGERSLFVNRVYTQRIEELNRAESAGVLAALFDHAESPDFQVRFRWRKGAVAIWDNRSTQHFAIADYFPQRRVMHRVAVEGAAVVAATR